MATTYTPMEYAEMHGMLICTKDYEALKKQEQVF